MSLCAKPLPNATVTEKETVGNALCMETMNWGQWDRTHDMEWLNTRTGLPVSE